MQPPFSGVNTAIITPFHKDGSLDIENFRKIIHLQKRSKIHGLVVGGTTGESPTLTDSELQTLVDVALEEKEDSIRIYVGTGSNDTRATVEKSKKYANYNKNGQAVDGVMAVVPYYNKPNQTGLREHFSAIAQAIPYTPLCLYNVPGRTGCVLNSQTFISLAAQHENIVCIKEAAGDIKVITELKLGLASLKRKVYVLSGDDPTYAAALLCGADGVISVTTHLIPGAMRHMWEAAEKNDFKTLQELHLKTYPINRDLFCAPNPVPLKWALEQLGVCPGHLRLPMTKLEEVEISLVKKAMAQVEASGIKLLS